MVSDITKGRTYGREIKAEKLLLVVKNLRHIYSTRKCTNTLIIRPTHTLRYVQATGVV